MQKIAAAINRFTFGEVSPLIISRDDLDKYPAGNQTLENFIPLLQGPIRRRGGTRFISDTDNYYTEADGEDLNTKKAGPVALINFIFSATTNYLLEIGNRYFRIYSGGELVKDDSGNPLRITTPWLQKDLFDENGVMLLKWVQSGDILYVVAPGQKPQKISRKAHNEWMIEDLPGWGDRPNAQCITIFRERLALGAGRKIYFSQSGAFESFVPAEGDKFSKLESFHEDSAVDIVSSGTLRWYNSQYFNAQLVFEPGEVDFTTPSTGGILATASNSSGFSKVVFRILYGYNYGAWIQIREGNNLSFGIYDHDGGMHRHGYIIFDPTVVEVIVSTGTGATFSPVTAKINPDDPLDVELMHPALWMVPVDQLAVGTSGDEYHIGENVATEPFGPANVKVTPETTYGSSPIQALRAGSSLLFVQRSSRKVREFIYNYASESYSAIDTTLAAEHITKPDDGSIGGLVGMVWQAEPIETLWCVRSDGDMVGLTFNNDQAMLAWHKHILGGGKTPGAKPGKIKSIAVLPGVFGIQDQIYMCVEREDIGSKTMHYIERLERGYHEGELQANLFYVDCGKTITGDDIKENGRVVTGLIHLEGQTVSVLADGAVQADRVVNHGLINLDYSASVVQVGVPYKSIVRTLPLNFMLQDGTTATRIKRFIGTTLRLIDSVGGRIGNDVDTIDLEFRTGVMRMDEPVPLFTGDHYVSWPGGFSIESFIKVSQDEPLPLIIAAIYPIIHVGNA